MPWQEVVTVELRQQFVHDALRRVVPVTELCAAYGISRKTGYKFLARYDAWAPPAWPISRADRTAHPRHWIRCCSSACSRPMTAIRTGGRGSCSASSASAGPRRPGRCAPPSRAVSSTWASSLPAGVCGDPERPGHRARRWRRRMPSGPPTTRASFAWAMGSTASRSRWRTATAACCSPVRPSLAPS
jgi:hypothetical protein